MDGTDRGAGTAGEEPSGARHGGALRLAIVAASVALVGLVWLLILTEVRRNEAVTLAAAHRDAANLAIAFSAHIERTLLGVDQTLKALRDRRDRLLRPGELSEAIASAPALRDLDASVAVSDHTGTLLSSRRDDPDQTATIAGLPYFLAHRGGGDRLVLGAPSPDPASRRCVIAATRPVLGEGGAFEGVIVLSFAADYLINLYRRVDVGRTGAVALIGSDGQVWGRVGPQPHACGSLRIDSEMRAVFQAEPVGTAENTSAVDGIDRILGHAQVRDQPLLVITGLGRDEALAETEQSARSLMLGGAALSLILLVCAALLLQELARRARRADRLIAMNRELAEARALADRRSIELATTVRQIGDGISIYGPDLRLVLSNERHRDLMELPAELVRPGTPVLEVLRYRAARGEFGATDDPDAEATRQYLRLRDRPQQTTERRMPSGRLLELRRTVTPDGGMVTLYRDITDQRRAVNALAEARRHAEWEAERKSELIAMVSHEIRTPLSGIMGLLELLERTRLAPDQREYLAIATYSGHALLDLLDDLLVHSRMEVGRLALNSGEVDPRALVRDVAALFAPVAARKDLTLEWNAAPELPVRVIADAARLRQVLSNMVSNAIRYSGSGTITINVDEHGRTARVPGPSEVCLRLSVADNGPGVPDDEKEQIFEPYVQARSSEDEEVGIGLGLAICNRLVGLFGGEIGVEDRPGGGAVFWFSVPVEVVEESSARQQVALGEPAGGRHAGGALHVLVVEDDPVNQFVAREFLECLGHTVTVTATAGEAERLLRQARFDVVLMDRQLPDGDGIEAIARIRNGPAHRNLPIVLVTAAMEDTVREAAFAAGADDILTKPYRQTALQQVLARLGVESQAA